MPAEGMLKKLASRTKVVGKLESFAQRKFFTEQRSFLKDKGRFFREAWNNATSEEKNLVFIRGICR